MPTMNIQISLKFHAVCAAPKVLQNYNDLGLEELNIAKIQAVERTRKLASLAMSTYPFHIHFPTVNGDSNLANLQSQHFWTQLTPGFNFWRKMRKLEQNF